MDNLPSLFSELLMKFAPAFASMPSLKSFQTITIGWLLCLNKKTITGIIRAAGIEAIKSHDAYQNLFSKAKWEMDILWKILFLIVCKMALRVGGKILLVGDDTIAKHFGKKIWGAGFYRDAVRSSKKFPAYCWGLNWVVLCVIIPVPFLKDKYIALPIMARLNPKDSTAKKKGSGSKRKKTSVVLMAEMLSIVAKWLPDDIFIFCGDGAYPAVAKQLPENIHLISRIREDAAIYQLPSSPKIKKSGRPPQKGKRLPSPKQIALSLNNNQWTSVILSLYGKKQKRLLYSFQAIWHEVYPNKPVSIVVVRDPFSNNKDEFFFSTDLSLSPKLIVFTYSLRWPIETSFRECKQFLGLNEPQSRVKQAVLRTTPFCLWLNSILKFWYVSELLNNNVSAQKTDAWYSHKSTISFQNMLSSFRFLFWQNYISANSSSSVNIHNIIPNILYSLSTVT